MGNIRVGATITGWQFGSTKEAGGFESPRPLLVFGLLYSSVADTDCSGLAGYGKSFSTGLERRGPEAHQPGTEYHPQ
jgi:hypothetical protein